jgi:hypothetical protein
MDQVNEPKALSRERTDPAHLGEVARAMLASSDEERIRHIRSERWIGYDRALSVIDRLEDLLRHPPKHRMPNLLLVGDTNNGKTAILQRFRELHAAFEHPDGSGDVFPVLIVHAPDEPSPDRFYNTILEALFAPYKANEKADVKLHRVIRLFRQVRLGMLVIDEIHDILGGSRVQHHQFLKVIKRLGNELQIPIVGAGTREAFNAIHADAQLANRFHPVILPKCDMGMDYLKLLASFERMLPLRRASRLTRKSLAMKLLALSEGTIGELATLVGDAAVAAIRNGDERISEEIIDTLGWVVPSERNRQR